MKTSQVYYADGPLAKTPSAKTVAHTFRVWRLELCCAWMRDPMPSLFYLLPCGRLHPGAVSFTLRVYRLMLGYRWYDAMKEGTP